MSTRHSRAGLMLGAIGLVCALPAHADDLRSTQALIESGLFLSQTEADAVYARLDAKRPLNGKSAPGTAAYWESGAVGLGQSERSGRLGWGGDATNMRIGADRELRTDLIVGASAGASIGGVGSADLSARTVARHADVYARVDRGAFFAKALVGGSSLNFGDMLRASNRATANGYVLRTGAQVGGMVEICGVAVTPTVALTANRHALAGYRESGASAVAFGGRQAAATIATMRLAGSRTVKVDPRHAVDLSAFVGADELVAFRASKLRASVAGVNQPIEAALGAPTGRGVVGGVGLATALAQGVTMKLDYDYGRRDGVATKTGRAKVGISF